MAEDETPRTTRDAFFGGRLVLEQPAKGHRSGTDAVLLAASVPRDFCGRVIDVGAGVGAVGLGIASTCPGAQVMLVDKDFACVALAARNAVANRLGPRALAIRCDILIAEDRRMCLHDRADLVVTNPPFHRAGQVRHSPDSGRRTAHVLGVDHTTGDWLKACLDLLEAKGTLIVLHHAIAVPDLILALQRGAGEVTLKPIHPRAGEPATRVLLRARKNSRAPFRLAAPLILHDGNGFSVEAMRLHRGETAIAW